MARYLFLFRDRQDNFAELSLPFVRSAGGHSAKIAVLTSGGPGAGPYVRRISGAWEHLGHGVAEVTTVGPDEYGGQLNEHARDVIEECSGILVCGGDTRIYHRLYVASPLGPLIREAYLSGIPYAGISAGAILAARYCAVWGGIVTGPRNRFYVRYRGCYTETDGDIELQVCEGLALIADAVFEPHFSEMGGFPRLLTVMERTGVPCGYGLDEPSSLTFKDEHSLSMSGRGRVYSLQRDGSERITVKVYDPDGGTVCLSGSSS